MGEMFFWGKRKCHWRTKAKKSHNLLRPSGEAIWHFGPCHHRWWNMGLPIRPWNEAANCTMEDCQFRWSKSRVKTMLLAFFFLHISGIVHCEFVPTGQSTKFTIWKYWKGCEKKVDGNDPNFLPATHGSCITTMHLLTRHCLWESF